MLCRGGGVAGDLTQSVTACCVAEEGQRFASAVTQQEVTDWVKSLGKCPRQHKIASPADGKIVGRGFLQIFISSMQDFLLFP